MSTARWSTARTIFTVITSYSIHYTKLYEAELIKPQQLEVKPGNDPQRKATLIAEPLERGFGLTLGNALRRVLMSSLQGAAITSVQIDNVLHRNNFV